VPARARESNMRAAFGSEGDVPIGAGSKRLFRMMERVGKCEVLITHPRTSLGFKSTIV
jgi:hypothetical protein